MKYFITGGAGFIGSNLCDRILKNGHEAVVFDNFSTGLNDFLEISRKDKKFTLIKGDLLDTEQLNNAIIGSDFVFHLAANADVRFGTDHPSSLQPEHHCHIQHSGSNAVNGIKKIAFSSTGSVYGEASVTNPGRCPFPIQTSLYGASKACEGLIEAYCEGFGFQSWIFRFVSILGKIYPWTCF